MATDAELLRSYARHHSEPAFTELVQRHINLVFSAALREAQGDSSLAEDITQSVFTELARKAPSLIHHPALAGWLYTCVRRMTANARRADDRRQRREQDAHTMNELLSSDSSESVWQQVKLVLDDAMHELSETDRSAVVLRFFEERSLKEVGLAFGLNENAARMRVDRALEKLQGLLAKRGVTGTASGVAVAITAGAVAAAPTGLAASIVTGALAATAVFAPTAIAATKAIAMTTLQKTIIGVALTAAVGTGIYEARHASSLRSRVQTLQQQQTPLAAQIQRLQKELADAATKLAALQQENGQLRKDTAELARLRGEVARWRAEFQDLARSKLEQSKSEPESEEESWLNRIKLLKQKVDQTPGARIPEMKYLKEEDWLRVAKHKLDTDDDYRVALSDLRTTSEGAFLNLAETALRKYVDANNGQFPTDLLELKSFFSDPVDDEVLQRYQIVPAASVPQGNLAGPASDWLITLKNPQDDAALALGRNGVSSFSYSNSPTMDILAPAIRALFDNTPVINGRKQINMKELLPYLTTPEQKAAYEKMVQDSK